MLLSSPNQAPIGVAMYWTLGHVTHLLQTFIFFSYLYSCTKFESDFVRLPLQRYLHSATAAAAVVQSRLHEPNCSVYYFALFYARQKVSCSFVSRRGRCWGRHCGHLSWRAFDPVIGGRLFGFRAGMTGDWRVMDVSLPADKRPVHDAAAAAIKEHHTRPPSTPTRCFISTLGRAAAARVAASSCC